MFISGPRTSTLGSETGTTSCALMMGQGGDHITSSAIFHYGNATCFYGNSFISSSGAASFNGSVNAGTGITIGTSGTNDISWNTAGGIKLGRTNVGPEYALSQAWDGVCAYIDLGASSQWNGGVRILPNGGGNVGIGTSTPSDKLVVESSDNYITSKSTSNVAGFKMINTSGTSLMAQVSNALVFDHLGTERMRISSGGDICVGATSNPYSAAGRGSIFLNGASTSLYGWGVGGTGTGYMYHNGSSVFIENSVSGGSFNLFQVGAGAITFNTDGSERMRITSAGRVGIQNTSPQGILEVGIVDANSTYGGLFFSTFTIPVDTWYTVFYAPSNDQWNAITEFTWTSSGDFNRSGAAYMRWAYESGAATLGVVYTLFNNSQNATASFRKSGNEIQVYITGGAANYYVQVRIQGSKAA
jgi:hypothetical protein